MINTFEVAWYFILFAYASQSSIIIQWSWLSYSSNSTEDHPNWPSDHHLSGLWSNFRRYQWEMYLQIHAKIQIRSNDGSHECIIQLKAHFVEKIIIKPDDVEASLLQGRISRVSHILEKTHWYEHVILSHGKLLKRTN